jgi:adenine-specific DNA glycosylase
VDSASQETTLSNGKKINSKKKRITLTEKFVITKNDSIYICKYSNSSITNYPNKKFPYLTLTEVKNWEFEVKQTKALTEEDVKMVAALETKTHSIVHFELNINKTCPNELIIIGKNINEQFIIEGSYLLSKSLNCL